MVTVIGRKLTNGDIKIQKFLVRKGNDDTARRENQPVKHCVFVGKEGELKERLEQALKYKRTEGEDVVKMIIAQ